MQWLDVYVPEPGWVCMRRLDDRFWKLSVKRLDRSLSRRMKPLSCSPISDEPSKTLGPARKTDIATGAASLADLKADVAERQTGPQPSTPSLALRAFVDRTMIDSGCWAVGSSAQSVLDPGQPDCEDGTGG